MKSPALTASEERILRSTIDDTQIFDVPVKTVKKLLALIDVERAQRAAGMDPIDAATARMREDAATFHPPVTPVPELAFIFNPAHPDIFCMRTMNGAIDDIFARAEATALLRTEFADRIFNVATVNARGTAGVISRPVSEICDLLERGALP